MKRGLRWNEDEDTSSDDSSTLDIDTEDDQASKSTKENSIRSSKKKTCPAILWSLDLFNDVYFTTTTTNSAPRGPEKEINILELLDFEFHYLVAVDSAKKKSRGLDFEALSQHGYKGGLSVLNIPPPKEPEQKQDWSWSSGREARAKEAEETYEDRLKTRDALADGELLRNVQTQKDRKNLSFQQKEKRKRDLGQASRGKNYVEEEKRLLRDSGVYSGFDS